MSVMTKELTTPLDRLIAGWDDEVVEFNEAGDGFSTSEIRKYISALFSEANLRGTSSARLVFGENNKTPHVVGTGYRPELGSLQSLIVQIAEGAEPRRVFCNIHGVADLDGCVVRMGVPPAPRGIPIAWNGHYYARAGESVVPLALDKLDEIRGQTLAHDWTAVVVPEATLADLDQVAIARARQGFVERHGSRIPAADITAWDDATFLARAKLTRNGSITRAALLLLGSDDSRHLLNPHLAQLTWNLRGEEQAYEHFHLPFLLTATALSKRIRNVQVRLLPPDELIYREISKYDERSILEAIYNCIAHQEYRANSRIIVTEYVDRLEFISVGEFYDGAPDEYALEGRMPRGYRNPFLVEAMTQLNLIDQMGYGIHRMVQDQVRRFLPLPDYDLATPGEVKLTIPGAVIDEAYSQLLMVRTDLPFGDVFALDRVQKKLPIADDAVQRLRRAKLIEGRKPHLHVSAAVAAATGGKADYIRTRALDNKHYEKLVIEYLTSFGTASRAEIDSFLVDKLSDALDGEEKYRQVSLLLTRLRRGRKIENVGSRKLPVWRLTR